MAARLNPNSDAWGGSWGSASAWGGSWGNSWGPLHEVEEPRLEPAGHWKHLFRPIKAAVSPEVKGVVRAKWNIKFPDAVVKLVIPAETEFTSCRVRSRIGCVADPLTGAVSPSRVVKTRTWYVVKTPTAGARSVFTRAVGYASGSVAMPFCGAGTNPVSGRVYGYGYAMPPKCIRNPTVQEMLAWL